MDRLQKSIQSGLQGQDPEKVKSLMSAITKYTLSCKTCNAVVRYKPKPRVCLPLASQFNEVVAFDVTFWNDPVQKQTGMILHPIDLATRLSAGTFLKCKDPKHVLDCLVRCWFAVFGAPKKVFSDNGGEFANSELVELVENLGVTFMATAAQASFSNGINERHNAILKDILNKLRLDEEHNSTPTDILLSYAIFAKNCLVDNLGFSPHQRVYGRNPNIPNINSGNICHANNNYESDHVREHLNLLHKSRIAYMKAENSDRIKRALNSRIFASDGPFYYGEKVFYWKESANKSACGWKGPGTVVGTEGKIVIIRHGSFINRSHETKVRRVSEGESLSEEMTESEKNLIPCKSDQSLLLRFPTNTMPLESNTPAMPKPSTMPLENNVTNQTPVINVIKEVSADQSIAVPERISGVEVSESNNSEKTDAGNDITGIVKGGRILRPRENIKPAARFDEVYEISDNDNRQKAIVKELNSWKTHEVYKEVDRNEATNIITTRWIFTDKLDENKVPYIKARLVIRGFEDKEKDDILSESPTANIDSLKIMLAVLPTLGYKPKKMDISTAFLQGKKLTRPVYVEPPCEAEVHESRCWLLLKGVYGLSEASRMWYERVNEVMVSGKFVRSAVDPALYFKYDELKNVICVLLCHVDDFLYGGHDDEITLLEKLIEKHFEIREIEVNSFMYCGFLIIISDTPEGFEISYSQPGKISTIKEIKVEQSNQSAPATRRDERQFRSVLGALQWHANSTRPDLSFGVSKLLGETKSLEVKHCILANKLLRKAKSGDPNQIVCKKLVGDLSLVMYTDASFANLRDMGSQRGSMGFLRDTEGRHNLLEYKSNQENPHLQLSF